MVDYCMCTGDGCPLKDNCARYRLKPCEYRQSYFVGAVNKEDSCEKFLDFSTFGSYEMLDVSDIDNSELIEIHKEILNRENTDI